MSTQNEQPKIHEAISVVRGAPNAEELAAVIAVLEAMQAEEAAQGKKIKREPHSSWARNTAQLRNSVAPGFGQWGASYKDGLN